MRERAANLTMNKRDKTTLTIFLILVYIAGTLQLHEWLNSIIRRYNPLGYHFLFALCVLFFAWPARRAVKTFGFAKHVLFFAVTGYLCSILANLLMEWLAFPGYFLNFIDGLQRKLPQAIIGMFGFSLLLFGWLQGALIGGIVYVARR